MSQFEDREKGFEAKFRRDKEREFKVTARRNKLLGLWAAEKMGLEEDDAEAYAREVVISDFAEPGDDDVVERVLTDMHARGIDISKHVLRLELTRLHEVASEDLAGKD
mgnify:CR=1 FL=1|jgi:hypothetical protein|tara:strand:- start:369 stop:692 length:324 start_codon:yes stop_codon:yes gene_type:complete